MEVCRRAFETSPAAGCGTALAHLCADSGDVAVGVHSFVRPEVGTGPDIGEKDVGIVVLEDNNPLVGSPRRPKNLQRTSKSVQKLLPLVREKIHRLAVVHLRPGGRSLANLCWSPYTQGGRNERGEEALIAVFQCNAVVDDKLRGTAVQADVGKAALVLGLPHVDARGGKVEHSWHLWNQAGPALCLFWQPQPVIPACGRGRGPLVLQLVRPQ
mmetsp:Transcript_2651/g.7979  ORF Transcript_2651/g.7979 Transcript_2651/m.7979 type:complete len:213 (+) Transcript_2651:309-947(+)